MNGNVSCSEHGCNEPVIGQCVGFDGPCGRFYCERHSNGRLCITCATAEAYYSRAVEIANKGTLTAILLGALVVIVILLFFFVGAGMSGIITWAILSYGGLFGFAFWWGKEINRKVLEAEQELPDFKEYFKAYQKKQSIRAAKIIAAVALSAALAPRSRSK